MKSRRRTNRERERNGKPKRIDPLLAEAERLLAITLPPPQIAWTSRAPADRSHARVPGDEWVVGIGPWLVKDGMHGPLHAGRELDFALFATQCDGLSPVDAGTPSVRWLGDDVYEVYAQVVARDEYNCVLDFGLVAFAWHPPAWMEAGTWVFGDVVLEPDSGTIRWTGFCEERGFPALMYSWRIRRVVLEQAPRISMPDGSGMDTNGPDRRRFTDVAMPDVDRDRRAGEMMRYYLHCTLTSRIPRMPATSDLDRVEADA